MRSIFLLAAAVTLTACGGHGHEHAGEGIEISNAIIHPPLPGQSTGVAFMRLDNHGDADRLLAVSSPASGRVELHTISNEDEIMRMRRVDGIDVPHGEPVELKSGGDHIMMFDANMVLGDEVVLTLDFEKAEDLTVVAPVIARGAKPKGDDAQGSHSGH
jgi:copper(I)-binding protein